MAALALAHAIEPALVTAAEPVPLAVAALVVVLALVADPALAAAP